MRLLLHAGRFLWVVAPLPSLMVTTFLVVGLMGAASIVADPGRGPRAVIPVLVLQAFAASTGFTPSARRGHYDLLLTGGSGRLRAALVQWVLSIVPGLATWLALAGVEAVVAGRSAMLASGTCAAMFVVSAVAWASTVGLPRFSGAIGWLLLCVTTLALVPTTMTDLATWHDSGVLPPAAGAVAVLLFPGLLVGRDVVPHLAIVLPALAVAAAVMMAALAWIQRTTFPLQAGQ
jgi:hypothetical protein